jgi:spore maturation protein CgeB
MRTCFSHSRSLRIVKDNAARFTTSHGDADGTDYSAQSDYHDYVITLITMRVRMVLSWMMPQERQGQFIGGVSFKNAVGEAAAIRIARISKDQ